MCSGKANKHTSNTGKKKYDKIVLTETCDKYDLELRFNQNIGQKFNRLKPIPRFKNGIIKLRVNSDSFHWGISFFRIRITEIPP